MRAFLTILLCASCASTPIERLDPEQVLGFQRVEPPTAVEPVASKVLLERLQRFVEVGERTRAEVPRGAPMPPAHALAWREVLADVETLTGASSTALDVVRSRLWLQTALEADGARFGDVPNDVAVHAQRTVSTLTMKLVTMTRGHRPLRANPATFGWPIDPVVVTSGYGHRTHPIHGDYRFHEGIDLEASRSQPVYAVAPGVVAFAGWNAGHGKQVELQHDPHLASRYSHLAAWSIQPGAVVRKGDVIGWAGKTGSATGIHLHFELRRDGESLDPEDALPRPDGAVMVSR